MGLPALNEPQSSSKDEVTGKEHLKQLGLNKRQQQLEVLRSCEGGAGE